MRWGTIFVMLSVLWASTILAGCTYRGRLIRACMKDDEVIFQNRKFCGMLADEVLIQEKRKAKRRRGNRRK